MHICMHHIHLAKNNYTYKTKDKLGEICLGALFPPCPDIIGAPLAPIRPSGHHVLGGLLFLLARGLLLDMLLLVLPLTHEPDDLFRQGLVVLDFFVKFFSNSLTPSSNI
jgi:hypothetical protein